VSDKDVNQGLQVGNKNPPKHTQFTKGVSGNPKGRPKGSVGWRKRLEAELSKLVTATLSNGKKKKLSKLEIGLTRLADSFAKGDAKIIASVLRLLDMPDPNENSSGAAAVAVPMPDKDALAFIMNRLKRTLKD
jgi:hypothetical protein